MTVLQALDTLKPPARSCGTTETLEPLASVRSDSNS